MGPQPTFNLICGSIGHWARETEIKRILFFNLFGLATISTSRAEGPMGPLLNSPQSVGSQRAGQVLDRGVFPQTCDLTRVARFAGDPDSRLAAHAAQTLKHYSPSYLG
jgi:hypothetical protein